MQPHPAAYLEQRQRFFRIAERKGGVVGRGGFGTVIQGFDSLLREPCTIKRQKTDDPTAERELACFNMFHAWPHANILKMTGMFFDRFDDVEYMYICTESCSTSLG